MKKIKYIYRLYKLLPVAALFCLSACDDDNNNGNEVIETMELTPSSTEIELDGDKPNETVLTFNWTKAREMPSDYNITYVTKMDIEGNDFNAAVRTEEEEGVFSRSYSTEELQQLLVGKWGQSVYKASTIQFRVIAKWDGGPKFAMPEVRTISVDIHPYIPIVFEADEVFLDGSAVPGERITLSKTLENQYQYAWLGELEVGELQIPLELEEETKYICPVSGDGVLQDGIAETVAVRTEPIISWKIEKAGEYRIIVDMEKKTVTIYSPDNKLEPKVVTWVISGEPDEERNTTVTELWMFGDATNWGWWKGQFTQSLADPQILVYNGAAGSLRNGNGVKFVVYGEEDYRNVAYAFTNPLTADGKRQNLQLAASVNGDLSGGYDSEHRNSYYRLPSGANFIVLDLRNMKIRAEMR